MKGKRKIRLVLGLLLTVLMVMPGGMIKAEEVEGAPPPAEETVAAPEVEVPETEPEAAEPVVEEPAPAEVPEEPPVAPVEEPAAEEKVEVPAVEEPKAAEPQDEPPLEETMKSAAVAPLDDKEASDEVSNFEDLDGDYKWGEKVSAEGTEHDGELGWFTEELVGAEAARGGHHYIKFGVIEINKVWMADRKEIPKAVAFKLYADGKMVGILPILSSKDWKTKLVVPVKIGEHVISYSIMEMPLKGFESTVKGMTITNQQMRYLSVKKVWIGDEKPEEKYDFRPESVTYRLKANGKFWGEERTLTEAKGWKEFIKVPAYDAKGKIHYEIVEQELEGYDTKVKFCEFDKMYKEEKHEHDEKCADIMIMNFFTNKKDITLTKIWDDKNNPDRPNKVMFELYRNEKFSKVVNIFAKDDWKAVETVAIFDKDWKKYDYTVDEKFVPEGYKIAKIEGLTITNKLIEMVEVKGEKFWWDNGKFRPDSVMVKLMANGEFVKELKVMPNEEGKWLFNFGKYPKYDEEEKPILYELKESKVKFYTSKVEGFNIYNQQWRWLTVKKVWEHDFFAEKQFNLRPEMIKYQLMLDGEAFGGERTLKEDKKWMDMLWVPGYDADGLIKYEVKEMQIEGYNTRYVYCGEYKGEEASRDHKHDKWCADITIINTFTNKKHIELEKIWDDNNNEGRPEEVIFKLYANGRFVKEVPLTEEGEWVEHVEVLIFGRDWRPIKYTVEEKVVPEGYKAYVDGLTIKNKLIEMEEIKGEKFWWDNGKFRPKFVMVKLMADGEFVKELKVMPDKEGRWLYDFGKYPKYDNEDKLIVYTLKEAQVWGYKSHVDGYNIYNQKWDFVPVRKIWKDDYRIKNVRPDMIKYQLLGDGVVFGPERMLSKNKEWKDMVFAPAYDAEGKIEYTVKEITVPGYKTTYRFCAENDVEAARGHEHNEKCEILIINTFKNEKEITLTKIWDDNNNKWRPGKVYFELYRNDDFYKKVEMKKENNWVEKLVVPVYDRHGRAYNYRVEEKQVPWGYEVIVDGLTITNKLKMPEMEEIKGEKFWWDNGGGRPKSIDVTLLANGKPVKTIKVMPNEEGRWLYDFGKLFKYDMHKKPIVYTLKEAKVWGYKSHVDGYDIYNQKWDFVPVRKIWKDDYRYRNVRPDMIKYQLLADGEVFGPERMLSKNKNWKDMVFAPAYDAEGKIEYTVKEITAVPGYETTYRFCTENDVEAARGHKHDEKCEILIINTFKNENHLMMKKVWDDNENEDRPEEVTFVLYQNGKEIKEVVISEEDDWMAHLTVKLYDWHGKLFEYKITEKVVPEGYEATVDGMTITNKLIKLPEMVEVKGEKTWLDDGTGRPEYIMVKLMANGELKETKKVMPVEGKWLYDFGEMPKFDDEDELIVYTIMEEPVAGYEMIKKDGFDIANRRVEITMISGEKTWDDLMNRPSEITVYLHRNGESFKEMVVKPDEAGKWLYEFKELAKFDEMGKPYVYTVSEKKIMFYDAHVTGYDIHNYQQRATLKILKVNENDVVLPGAVFEIYDVMGKLLKTATTGADGTISMVLPLGAYRIRELSPPAGYKKIETFTMAMLLKDGEVVTVEIENEFLEFDDVSPKPLPETPTLPSTGSVGGNAFYLFGMASIAFGLFSLKRKRV